VHFDQPDLQLSLFTNISCWTQFRQGLWPFLDTLPEPFTWLVESDSFTNIIYTGRQSQFEGYSNLAQDLKGKGNEAFSKGQRKVAIKAYKEGIARCIEALNTQPSDEKEKGTVGLLAVLRSDFAATYLLPGEGIDAKKALDIALDAEYACPSDAKACVSANCYSSSSEWAISFTGYFANSAIVALTVHTMCWDPFRLHRRLLQGDYIPQIFKMI
jgi:hypothetical protein